MSPPTSGTWRLRWIFRVLVLLVVSIAVAAASRDFLKARRASQLLAATQRQRGMYFTQEYERGFSEGERLLRRFPESSELKAWTLLSASPSSMGHNDKAVHAAEEMTVRHPEDPWGWFALAGPARGSDQALAASEKALAMMPRHPDFLWMKASCMQLVEQLEEAAAFVDAHRK